MGSRSRPLRVLRSPGGRELDSAGAGLQPLGPRGARAGVAVPVHPGLAQANGDSRDAPELALTLTRERGARSEPYQNLAKLSLKIPFGGQARNGPRMAQANVELSEALAELHAGREQLAQDIDSARLAHELGQQQARAQAEALQLAEQRLGWIQRAVRAGQLSAPEQWRAQSELHEARSQAQRAQLEAGRAHSRYLQAIGALP
jgi:cobalt-zinc-cadmium efflux system outer membrane protein